MEDAPAAGVWRPWTVWLPCVLALLWSGLLILLDIAAGLFANLSDSAPAQVGWVDPAIWGHLVLAGASVVALVIGLRRPARRRAAAITAWVIIPVGFAWLVLTVRLLGGS